LSESAGFAGRGTIKFLIHLKSRYGDTAPTSNRLKDATMVNLKGLGYLFATSVLWGINWPIMKFLVSELPPLSARAIAGVVGAALTLCVAATRKEMVIPPTSQWRRLLIAAGFNFTAWMAFTTIALLWLRASETVIIAYTLPIWTAVLARPLLGERFTFRRGLGMLIGLSGVCLLMLTGQQAPLSAKMPGVALALLGSILFGLGAVLTKRAPLLMPPAAAVGWQIGLGTVPLLACMIVERPKFDSVDTAGWIALIASGVLAMSVGYLTWFAALKRLPASLATTGSLLVPIIGVLASAVALGEPLGLRECGALALTLSGIAIATKQ
jgi:drug/metabolite transporter (DMT)-like permease